MTTALKRRIAIGFVSIFAVILHFIFFCWSYEVIGQHFIDFFCDTISDTSCLRISYREQALESTFLSSVLGAVMPLAILMTCAYLILIDLLHSAKGDQHPR